MVAWPLCTVVCCWQMVVYQLVSIHHSVGWELIELVLPYEFTKKDSDNKMSDIIVNCLGFYFGMTLKEK